jgi:chaperonin GroES
MLTLEKPLKLSDDIAQAANLTDRFSAVDLARIADEVVSGYDEDERSRFNWLQRSGAGMDLAMQITEEKSSPWPGCANVAFPLVTIAALQFHARAYPAIMNGGDVVKCTTGFEPTPEEEVLATRVGQYMSYQVLEEDSSWEEGQDRLLLNYAIVGCAFKKSRYSPNEGTVVGELVLAQDLVLDYYAKSVEKCRRKTHVYPLHRNDIVSGIRAETPIYRNVEKEPWFQAGGQPDDEPNREGTSPPARSHNTPFTTLEQHCWLDLDADGYEEPYIILVERDSKQVLRIVARWESDSQVSRNSRRQITSIQATEYFTKYGFIPSPDGSIYDMGFGTLLGPLNETVSSAINQLLDSGTMAVAAGGFLGRGAKIKGGVYTFAPFEWKRVDSTGEDLSKSIYPLPVREPSMVLFNLLSLLIDYTNRISGATESMVGENPGQNTPAETSRSMVEQGMKVYAAIFKRTWRAMKEEFKARYTLNAFYAPLRYRQLFLGDPNRICPAADPNIVSDSERFMRASAIAQRAATVPGYDPAAVEENFLRALRVDNWQRFYKGVDPNNPPKDVRVQIAEMKLQEKQLALQWDQQKFVAELMEERRMNQAELVKIQAEVVKLMAEAEGEADNRDIVRMQTALAALKARDESLRGRVDQLIKVMELESEPERKRVDTGAVRRLVEPSGDGGAEPLPEGEEAGVPGGMG